MPDIGKQADDSQLDELESDLDSVESALGALDADDLELAESLAESLDTSQPEVTAHE